MDIDLVDVDVVSSVSSVEESSVVETSVVVDRTVVQSGSAVFVSKLQSVQPAGVSGPVHLCPSPYRTRKMAKMEQQKIIVWNRMFKLNRMFEMINYS